MLPVIGEFTAHFYFFFLATFKYGVPFVSKPSKLASLCPNWDRGNGNQIDDQSEIDVSKQYSVQWV